MPCQTHASADSAGTIAQAITEMLLISRASYDPRPPHLHSSCMLPLPARGASIGPSPELVTAAMRKQDKGHGGRDGSPMLLEVSKPVELFVSPSWIDPDPDPDIGKNTNRWKLTCIKCLLCLKYHVTYFPGIILYHHQTLILARDKEAEAWGCEVSCSRWHSKEVVESELEPRACTLNHSVCITSLPRGTPQQTQVLFLPILGQSQTFQIMQWGLSVR